MMKTKDLISIYSTMLEIRLFEERLVALYPVQDMKTPIHLCIGQEAIAAGVCHHLKKEDLIFTTHRCHGHVIAKGMPFGPMMAELYGRSAGCSSGKGGSMHLVDPERGILATSAIVGGGIALAVGASLSLKLRRERTAIVVSFFGDGATDEGVFYESLNFAALKKLPILFICENNFYATNSPLLARQPLDNIFRRPGIFGIKGFRADGNDAAQVASLAGRLVQKVRQGGGPVLLECRTYRWKGHVGPDCDVEKGCRPRYELDTWMKKCPVRALERYLLKKRALTKQGIDSLRAKILAEISAAEKAAKDSSEPSAGDVATNVYFGEK